MSDLSSSLKEIFNERISSPFYGSLIVSWLLWNWKIPYITFFVDQDKLGYDSINKIDYIFKHCDSIWLLVVGPLASTGAIIFLLPYLTNFAYRVTAKFDRRRKDIQIEIDQSQVLTVAQSLRILSDTQKQEENFKNLLTIRDEEIKLIKQQLDSALNQIKPRGTTSRSTVKKDENYSADLKDFFSNNNILIEFEKIVNMIQLGYDMEGIPASAVQYCVAYNLIESIGSNRYKLTDKGKFFLKEQIKRKSQTP